MCIRDRVFHPLVHTPDGRNGRSCADPKPGSRSFLPSPTQVQGPKDLGHLLLPSQATAESWTGSEQPCLEPVPIWDASASGQGVNPLRHSADPDPEYFSMCLLTIWISSFGKCLFNSFTHFLTGSFVLFLLNFLISLYILVINLYQLNRLQILSSILLVSSSLC